MIFLSYARKDGEQFVIQLEAELNRHNLKTWRDKRGIDPALDFTAEIERAIVEASHVVVCITPDACRSNSYVRREIGFALLKNKPVIVARFANVDPPLSIVNHSWVDFFSAQYQNALHTLLEWLDKQPSKYKTHSQFAEDLFKPYLEQLYEQIVHIIGQTVSAKLIELYSEATPDAVDVSNQARLQVVPPIVFSMAGIEPTLPASTETEFDDFHKAFRYYDGQILLLGAAGSGKTTTLMSFARDAVAHRLENPSAPLPIYAPVVSWDPYKHMSPSVWLSEVIPPLDGYIDTILDEGRALLLFDGLDELGAERPFDPDKADSPTFDPRIKFMENILTPIVEKHPRDPLSGIHNQIVITSRTDDYDAIGTKLMLKGAVTLRPLTDEQIETALADLPSLWESLKTDRALWDIARTPLLLSLLIVGFRDRQELIPIMASELGGLFYSSDLRDHILMTYIERRYAHEERKPSTELPPLNELITGLGMLAADNAAGGRRQDQNGDYYWVKENVFSKTDFVRMLPNYRALTDVALKLNLFVVEKVETYRFIHFLLRDSLAFAYALGALRNTDKHVACQAAETLRGLRDPRAIRPLVDALYINDPTIRNGITGALAGFGQLAVEPLVEALQIDSATVRENVSLALTNLGELALNPLSILLGNSNNREVRKTIIHILGGMGDSRVVIPLVKALHDPDRTIRYNAAGYLGQIGDSRAVEPLIQKLWDSESPVRANAIHALIEIGEPAVEPLIACLNEDPRDRIIAAIVFALGQIGDPRAVETLISVLDSAGWDIARQAEKALLLIGTHEALEAVKWWRRDNYFDES